MQQECDPQCIDFFSNVAIEARVGKKSDETMNNRKQRRTLIHTRRH